jgi:hypothetical protein
VEGVEVYRPDRAFAAPRQALGIIRAHQELAAG